jgi:hypothetical protein
MRVDQLQRRLLYLVFGAVPASYLLVDANLVGDAISSLRFDALWRGTYFIVLAIGALIGTTGLWVATATRLPLSRRWHRWSIACAMLIGLATMLPWSALFMYLSVANVIDGHTVEDLSTFVGWRTYAGRSLLLSWWFLGPIFVAGHFLIGNARRASNNALERAQTGSSVGAAGASDEFAPATPSSAVPRPAQRGR